jgi:hypothetical protein
MFNESHQHDLLNDIDRTLINAIGDIRDCRSIALNVDLKELIDAEDWFSMLDSPLNSVRLRAEILFANVQKLLTDIDSILETGRA